MEWLTESELLERAGLSRTELEWFGEHFREQMRFLIRQEDDGATLYASDAVAMLQGLSAMVAQGATPEQIKGWFGLAAGRESPPG